VVHAVVFSFMSGMIHSYYTVAMAPGLAMTVAGGASILWRHRAELAARAVLGVAAAVTGVWSAVIMEQQGWLTWLGWTLAGLAVVGGMALLAPAVVRRPWRTLGTAAVTVALVGALGATTAATAETALTPGGGTDISLGGGGAHRDGDQASASPALVSLLQQAGTRWSAAAVGAMSAAPLQLASNTPVMSVGGFVGSDPAPTLAQFQADVATGQIRYFVTGGQGGQGHGGGGAASSGSSSQITAWVTSHFTPTTIGGRTVYDLTRPTS
jgi:hypothetical protein